MRGYLLAGTMTVVRDVPDRPTRADMGIGGHP
jgi:hypothetical protein